MTANFMNESRRRLPTIGAAVKTLRSQQKVANTVQQLILEHPLTASVQKIKVSKNMLEIGLKNDHD